MTARRTVSPLVTVGAVLLLTVAVGVVVHHVLVLRVEPVVVSALLTMTFLASAVLAAAVVALLHRHGCGPDMRRGPEHSLIAAVASTGPMGPTTRTPSDGGPARPAPEGEGATSPSTVRSDTPSAVAVSPEPVAVWLMPGAPGFSSLPSTIGVAATSLRPAGYADLARLLVPVRTVDDRTDVPPGQPVQVVDTR